MGGALEPDLMMVDQAMPAGAVMDADLEIPGLTEPLPVRGRVAYHLDGARARQHGRTPGVGVQFLQLPVNSRAVLDHYVWRLETHRARPERRQTEDVPLTGSLSQYLVPEVFLSALRRGEGDFWALVHRPFSDNQMTRDMVRQLIEETRRSGARTMPEIARALKAIDTAGDEEEQKKLLYRFKNFLYKTVRI